MKRCPRCEVTQEIVAFGTQKTGRVNSWCRACKRKRESDRRIESARTRPDIKTCTKCKQTKPVMDSFRTDRDGGLHSWCISCRRQNMREWRAAKTPEQRSAIVRRDNLKKLYGMTHEEWERLAESQDYKCAICLTQQSDQSRRLHIDHDHSTGKVRGLLCTKCNTALGQFMDSDEILANAIAYLRKSRLKVSA